MYVEFTLPTGAGGLAAGHINFKLELDLDEWSKKYSIKYHKKTIKYKVKVTFNDPNHYTFFALTWDPINTSSYIRNFRLIEPMS